MSPTIKNKNFTKEFYENMLKIQFYLQKNLTFIEENQTFLSLKILRVPAYQGQSDSEYLTSLVSQKLHLPE